jgi:hypothetical protein
MDEKFFNVLLEKARRDEAFFHDLVFRTEKALRGLDDVPKEVQERLLKLNPEAVLKGILTGNLSECGVTVQCTVTCGHTSSMIDRLGRVSNPADLLADCGVTVQCGQTCTHTSSNPLDRFGDLSQSIRNQIQQQLG